MKEGQREGRAGGGEGQREGRGSAPLTVRLDQRRCVLQSEAEQLGLLAISMEGGVKGGLQEGVEECWGGESAEGAT